MRAYGGYVRHGEQEMTEDDATRKAHRERAEDEYFDSRPAIDCNDRRRVFQAGFDRGWKSAHDDVERFLKKGERA